MRQFDHLNEDAMNKISLIIICIVSFSSVSALASENKQGFQVSKMLSDQALHETSDQFPKGEIIETIDVDGYTYFKYKNEDEENWAATSRLDLPKGTKVILMKAYPMYDFKSKALNRTFKKILFVSQLDVLK